MSKAKDSRTFDFGVSAHTGLVRQENQDCSAEFESINGHIFIVCDGMGGHAGGAVASSLAVESIRAYLENHYFDVPEDALKAAIEFANSVVYRKSRESKEIQHLGTTIVMTMVRYDKVHYAHVGDSRLYIFTDGSLQRLTRDHSRVQNLVDKGIITEQEARSHPDRNVITRVLGTSPNIEIEFCSSPATPALNDIVMLCTDGLFGMIEDAEISDVLRQNLTVQEKADRLVQLANEKGGKDNTTVQLIYFNNVTNKKSKFIALFQIPKELRPVIKENERPFIEPIIENEPDIYKPSADEENQIIEPANEDEPIVTEQVNQVEPIISEPKIEAEPVIIEPVQEKEPLKAEPRIQKETIEDEEKSSFLDRFGFYRNLKKKPDLMQKLRILAFIAGVVFIAFVFWDLFIKQSATTTISDTNRKISDTLKEGNDDTDTIAKQNQLTAKPDTIWISYSVKKGEFLGTIATKMGVKIDFIKKKNKLVNDNIREKQKLDIPTKANHLVKSGENIDIIAKKYQIDKKRILKANDINDEKNIKVNKSLIIPFK